MIPKTAFRSGKTQYVAAGPSRNVWAVTISIQIISGLDTSFAAVRFLRRERKAARLGDLLVETN